jgi:hypothetical protein
VFNVTRIYRIIKEARHHSDASASSARKRRRPDSSAIDNGEEERAEQLHVLPPSFLGLPGEVDQLRAQVKELQEQQASDKQMFLNLIEPLRRTRSPESERNAVYRWFNGSSSPFAVLPGMGSDGFAIKNEHRDQDKDDIYDDQ